jgi:hypothetical protein
LLYIKSSVKLLAYRHLPNYPTLSLAVAWIFIVPETVELWDGIILTGGWVISPPFCGLPPAYKMYDESLPCFKKSEMIIGTIVGTALNKAGSVATTPVVVYKATPNRNLDNFMVFRFVIEFF